MNIYRHGDLLIKPVSNIPKEAKKLNHKTLAEGEMTGHHHTLSNGTVYETPTKLKFFIVEEPTELTHQEHKTLTIEKGMYEVLIEQEYDPFLEAVRQVQD